MKRIVNGVTYNTDTSTRLAATRWENEHGNWFAVLYVTRGGAYFAHNEQTRQIWNENNREHETDVVHSFDPMCPEAAHKWLMEGDVEVFHNPFDDPPEASAEAEPGATIYLRVPAALKRRVDEAARNDNVSANAWVMRCLERCLPEPAITRTRSR